MASGTFSGGENGKSGELACSRRNGTKNKINLLGFSASFRGERRRGIVGGAASKNGAVSCLANLLSHNWLNNKVYMSLLLSIHQFEFYITYIYLRMHKILSMKFRTI